MAVRAAELKDGQVARKSGAPLLFGRYTTLHMGAVIAHALSYLTTLWFVQWVWADGALSYQGVIAYGLELLLFAFKTALWSDTPEGRGVGWAGVSFDGLINMGGLVPYAPAILTFPPVAIVLAFVGWALGGVGVSLAWFGAPFVQLPYNGAPIGISASVLLVALGGGILLSAAPQRLWRVAERS